MRKISQKQLDEDDEIIHCHDGWRRYNKKTNEYEGPFATQLEATEAELVDETEADK